MIKGRRVRSTEKLNKEWHLAHKMPKNATLEQRIAWHEQHVKHCKCREMPESIAKAIAERNKLRNGS